MTDIDKILNERKETHGKFEENATVVQALKDAVRLSSKMEHMHKGHKEAVDAILCKVGRIVTGDPFEADHWVDIKGYATLGQNIKQSVFAEPCKHDTLEVFFTSDTSRHDKPCFAKWGKCRTCQQLQLLDMQDTPLPGTEFTDVNSRENNKSLRCSLCGIEIYELNVFGQAGCNNCMHENFKKIAEKHRQKYKT